MAADIVTQRLLSVVLMELTYTPKILVKYVDDLFAIIPSDKITETLDALNNFHPKLQFTIEEEIDNKLPYLDLLIIRGKNNTLDTDWYQKSFASNRILNFHSYHPYFQKINTARNFIQRVLSLSSGKYHNKNIKVVYNRLIENNFPKTVINKLIYSSLKTVNNNNVIDCDERRIKKNVFKSVTYVKFVSEGINKIVTDLSDDTRLAYKNHNCLRNIFTKLKDPVPLRKKTNVIYKIPCLGDGTPGSTCNLSYVGQTKQYLENRIRNHKYDLKKPNDPTMHKTALLDHFQTLNHYPNFDAVSVLSTQQHYNKRLTTEALHIYTENTYNKKRDTDDLAPVFCSIIDNNNINKRKNTNIHTDNTNTFKKRKLN